MSMLSAFRSLFTRNAAAATAAASHLRATVRASQQVPAANTGAATYPASRLTDADKAYLMHMATPYLAATHGGQIFYDVLTDDAGKTWAALGGDATDAGKALQAQLSAIINYADRLPGAYAEVAPNYTGPLVSVVGAAVAHNLR